MEDDGQNRHAAQTVDDRSRRGFVRFRLSHVLRNSLCRLLETACSEAPRSAPDGCSARLIAKAIKTEPYFYLQYFDPESAQPLNPLCP
jgi:hypothetical protein